MRWVLFAALCLTTPWLMMGCEADESAGEASARPDAAALPMDAFKAPPPGPDASYRNSEDTLEACVDRLDLSLLDTFRDGECDGYDDADRMDLGSAFHMTPVVAVCLELTCDNLVLEGHNGIPAARSCGGVLDLQKVLERAAMDALAAEQCAQPSYSLRRIPLDDFVGGERCDQLHCSVGPDGTIIRVLPE